MDNYETGIYTDNPDDTLRYMQTTQPVDLWGYPKQETDMVEVVRCKDCRHYRPIGRATGICAINDIEHRLFADWYCADGERRSE